MKDIQTLSAKQLLKYSWRSFLRNKRKNIILAMTIAMGLLSYIFISSFLKGVDEQAIKAVLTHEFGEVQVLNKKHFEKENFPVEDTIAFPKQLQDSLGSLGWKASPQQKFFANIVLPSPPFRVNGTIRHTVLAIDFARDEYYQAVLQDHLVAQKQASLSIAELLQGEGVIISTWLANQISARIGYPLILVTKGKGGFFEQIELEIVGIIDTNYPQLDRGAVIMSYATADEYLLLHNEYTHINFIRNFNVPSRELLSVHTQQIQQEFDKGTIPFVIAKSWRDMQIQRYKKVFWEYPNTISYMYLLFIFIIALAGMTSTISMNIISRNREIGTMQAFGMSRKHIMYLYSLEMGWVGIVASLVAAISGIGVMALMVHKGLDYSAFFKDSTFGFPSSGVLKGSWNFSSLVTSSIIGIGFASSMGFIIVWCMRKQYSNVITMLRART